MRVCLPRVCVCVCFCIGQTPPVPLARLHIQSSPDGAYSHFLRWLKAVHVNNNNICSTEDGDAKFIIIFEIVKSTVELMNQ